MGQYAVIDVETTGLSPAQNHRILEVAVVLADDNGNLVDEWETLVNPLREVGAAEIHGLTAADVYAAPTFDEILPELVSLLSGRMLVAHNLAFDARFLAAEFARAGHAVELDGSAGLCTMRVAEYYLPSRARSLEACCECIGYGIDSAHTALEDARATAKLLAYYISQEDDFLGCWIDAAQAAKRIVWSKVPSTAVKPWPRKLAALKAKEHFLQRLPSRAPRRGLHPEADKYLMVLDRVLLDGRISCHEADELVETAAVLGLSREDAATIHQQYLAALARLALEDGPITSDGRADLVSVAELLGLSADHVDSALQSVSRRKDHHAYPIRRFTLQPGDRVVFTGEAPGMSRSELEYEARMRGLWVTGSVSKKTKLVAAADPDSLSGKARRARSLGIPIVDYSTFIQMMEQLESCEEGGSLGDTSYGNPYRY